MQTAMSINSVTNGVKIIDAVRPLSPEYAEILTPEALRFVAVLQRRFGTVREELLQRRIERQKRIDAGDLPKFLEETSAIRGGSWKIAPVPADLQDRRVEITGPVDRKMIINGLNSGAKVFMADFEDATSPTWNNIVEGQINLRDAINRTISFENPQGKQYRLNDRTATLLVRPRGWHLPEKHVLVDGKPVSASLFDFALYFFHNAENLRARGTGPYFYLPKLESHLEARLWNDVFVMAQEELGIPQGTIKATVLIETILAAFETEEILYELREHSCGLNCGRWDYIFSFIKKFHRLGLFILPDRSQVTMTVPFMRAYCLHVIKTCHMHGAHAIGGMAAQIPIKRDPEANEIALAKVREDKVREAADGHDGTWVAHPGLVPIAIEAFNVEMESPNQIDRLREDVHVTAADLLQNPTGSITESGVRMNISVGIQYLESWLRGIGCVPLYNLMEDAATAEISRTQIWQWIHHPKGILDDGRKLTKELFDRWRDEELSKIESELGSEQFAAGKFELAAELFATLSAADELAEFLTLPAYKHLL